MGQEWVSPSEFWTLAPGEVWWLIDAHKGAENTGTDYEELYQLLEAAT